MRRISAGRGAWVELREICQTKILSALGFAADTDLLTPLLAQKNNNLPA
jgi:hypothetical protein